MGECRFAIEHLRPLIIRATIFQILVSQQSTVDSQSRQLGGVEPNITKDFSTWLPYTGPPTTGILHAIWLYRNINDPELETLLPHVGHPTDNTLRKAGMVLSKLGGGLRPE
ncbi:hypothetical protein DFH09DRAFT_1093892 [Mycena vulgaris]|nr:hypothetical protein DFH09DRAFT_1093892 [Mycena vulgaris]